MALGGTFQFLSLPARIRTRIYRILFRPHNLFLWDPYIQRPQLCASFLRTCRQVSRERSRVLYGENMFVVGMASWGDPPDHMICKNMATHPCLPLMTRFIVNITHYHDDTEPYRTCIRWVTENILLKVPRIEYLAVCMGDDIFTSAQPVHIVKRRKLIDILRTWLGLVRNVKYVGFASLSRDEEKILRERFLSTGPASWTRLAATYNVLEKHARSINFGEDLLIEARDALEDNDEEKFRKLSEVIWNGTRKVFQERMDELDRLSCQIEKIGKAEEAGMIPRETRREKHRKGEIKKGEQQH